MVGLMAGLMVVKRAAKKAVTMASPVGTVLVAMLVDTRVD